MTKRLLLLLAALTLPAVAQNIRVDGRVSYPSGAQFSGVLVSVCAQTAITAISESGNTVTVTSTLAPEVRGVIIVSGVVPNAYNGTFNVTNTSSTRFSYINNQPGLSAGTVFGSAVVLPCTNPIPLCASSGDSICTSPNPVVASPAGNYSFYVQSGNCTTAAPCSVQYYGSGLPASNLSDQSWGGGGTITGVTAGIGASGGGTSGNVTVNVTNPLPTGVAAGSACVSNGVGQPCVYQSKPVIDIRDSFTSQGIGDCTYTNDSGVALSALTNNVSPGINGAKLLLPSGCHIKLTSTWTIKNAVGFTIGGPEAGGGAGASPGGGSPTISWCGAAGGTMIDMEYVNSFKIHDVVIDLEGTGCGNNPALVGINVDKTGTCGGCLNTTDGQFDHVQFTAFGSTAFAANTTELYFSAISTNNVERMRVTNSSFNGNLGISGMTCLRIGPSANAKNYEVSHNTFTNCTTAIYQQNGSANVFSYNEMSPGASGVDFLCDNAAGSTEYGPKNRSESTGASAVMVKLGTNGCGSVNTQLLIDGNEFAVAARGSPGTSIDLRNRHGLAIVRNNTWDQLSGETAILSSVAADGGAGLLSEGNTYPNSTQPTFTDFGYCAASRGDRYGVTVFPQQFYCGASAAGAFQILETTVATGGSNTASPPFQVGGSIWNGSTPVQQLYTWQVVPGSGTNPATSYVLTCSGSSGACLADLTGIPTTKIAVAALKRLNVDNATTLTSGAFTLGAGWGSTASIAITNANSKDSAYTVTITTGGTGIAANPTLQITFADGTWTQVPVCKEIQSGGNDIFSDTTVTARSATSYTYQYNGTPTTGKTYELTQTCTGT